VDSLTINRKVENKFIKMNNNRETIFVAFRLKSFLHKTKLFFNIFIGHKEFYEYL
jgi:hypothetical protein